MIGEGRRSCGWAREGKGDGRGSSIRGRRGRWTGMWSSNTSATALPFATPPGGRVCGGWPWCTQHTVHCTLAHHDRVLVKTPSRCAQRAVSQAASRVQRARWCSRTRESRRRTSWSGSEAGSSRAVRSARGLRNCALKSCLPCELRGGQANANVLFCPATGMLVQ